ncbi:basic amino acid/polyamine antiporter [Thioalkalivibrio sp. XN8]|uniref:basic amino acid/polyamine antiporter n=1 Tax=Thioalkalivibrio sp. XN8 TaxID=2712863 RepID=UPI0013EB6CDF|nr:basic amino acid/polyamine antiporter [Thioalkalivibrio sp. XN8]NGP53140.1 amino acid permease [Thioalkalivibrio sp. XN8]
MSASTVQKLALPALVAMVVGSMVGSGIFTLPSRFAAATGVYGALIAWVIAGGGMLMLGFVFQSLAQRKPDIDSGIFAYAKYGFGEYWGFAAAIGFWLGTCVGNVSYWVLIKSTLGAFFPVFGDGNTLTAVLVASALVWGFHFLILRGVQGAAGINKIVTIAKIVPLLVFIVVLLFHFDPKIFADNLVGGGADASYDTIWQQVRRTMLVTVFVFIGIEAASVYSRYARDRADVGRATVIGFFIVIALLVAVTVLSFGVLPRAEIATMRAPSVAGVMESMVGPWGAKFISAGLIVSVLGAYLAWSLLAAEVPYLAAKYGLFPKYFEETNDAKVPKNSLLLTNLVVQAFLIITMFTQYAFVVALELTSALTLIPYLLVAAYGLKLAWTGETYERDPGLRKKELVIAGVATFYALLMIYAGGLKYILLSALIYLPSTVLYYRARSSMNLPVFAKSEAVLFGVIVLGAVIAIWSLATGQITI